MVGLSFFFHSSSFNPLRFFLRRGIFLPAAFVNVMREFDAWLAARPQMEQTSVLSRIRAVSPALLTVFGDWRRGLPFCVEAAIILKEQAQIGAWQFQPQAFAAFQARRQQENTRRAAHGVPALAASALTAAAR